MLMIKKGAVANLGYCPIKICLEVMKGVGLFCGTADSTSGDIFGQIHWL